MTNGEDRSVRKQREKLRTPIAAELSAYMRSLVEKRWKNYPERLARG
jgi:hypothetical protein